MIFDKNQSIFPSAEHREVWWWAVGIVPPSDSLIDEVKSKCSTDVLEGCYQWYDYFNELCEDMYTNIDKYTPASARQYRDILEIISSKGTVFDDRISLNIIDWKAYAAKLNKSKAYISKNITLNQCLDALKRTGLIIEQTKNSISFRYNKYKKIFHAMNVMEKSPNIRNTPARHHFAHCEFRQLFKSYSANYDELLRRASDESLYIAHSIHDYAKTLRITRYIHFDIVKYKYKNIRILDFNLYGDEYPTLRINFGTCADQNADLCKDEYYRYILSKDRDIQEIFTNNLLECNDSNHSNHNHQLVKINGQDKYLCPCSKIRINPFKEDMQAIYCFIEARKASIDQYIASTALS